MEKHEKTTKENTAEDILNKIEGSDNLNEVKQAAEQILLRVDVPESDISVIKKLIEKAASLGAESVHTLRRNN